MGSTGAWMAVVVGSLAVLLVSITVVTLRHRVAGIELVRDLRRRGREEQSVGRSIPTRAARRPAAHRPRAA